MVTTRQNIGVACLLMAACTLAHADELRCPESISVQEAIAQAPADGWNVDVASTPRYLAGVSFFDGEPSRQVSLAPMRDVAAGRDRVATWRLTGEGPVWFVCRYLDTGVRLAKALPNKYTECKVTYGPGGIVRSVHCKP